MRRGSGVVALVATLTLQACLSSSVVLHVAADGSGRAVITSRVYEQALQDLQSMFLTPPEDRKSAEESMPPPGEEELSAQFGTRVRLESTELEKTADGVIRKTIVGFPDVSQVRLLFPPIVTVPLGGGFGMSGVTEPPVITFAIRPHENGDRLLLVRMPEGPIGSEANEPDPVPTAPESRATPSPTPIQNIRRAIEGMSVQFSVELDEPLLRTNAPGRDGNVATILNVDVDRALDNLSEDKMSRAVSPGSIQKLLWEMGDVPGATLPTEREIFLEFAPPAPPEQTAPQAARPDTEIFLAPLESGHGRIQVGNPVNISRSPGYDNQPFFTPDGGALLFTSVRGGGTQSDIYRYDISAARLTQITDTPESEYSPTVTPAGNLSVVRVEIDKDRTQRLWQFTVDGREPRVLIEAIKPVGYHAWADDHTLALFVLGEPSTLQVADTRTGAARVVASDIGRSLQPIPGGHTVSFVQRERSGSLTRLLIQELNPATGETRLLAPAVAGVDEANLAWTPDGTLLMASADVLYAWRRAEKEWRPVAALERLGLKGVSRIAVSPAGDRIALVGTP